VSRIRTIKPEFWKHEDLSELPPETHMLAAALLNYADDEGYFNANPRLVQADCCPLREDSTSVRRSIDELSRIGYIRLFEGVDGKSYGHVTKFLQHQRVDRPRDSKIKGLEDSTNSRRTFDEPSAPEWNGMEGNGREGNTLVGSIEPTPDEPVQPKSKAPQCPVNKIIEAYQANADKLIQPRIIPDSVRDQISNRWRQSEKHQSLEFWENFFSYCNELPLLTGNVPKRDGTKPFRAGIEWVVNPTNFAKIINGNYEDATV
jgi:hypothetical protein